MICLLYTIAISWFGSVLPHYIIISSEHISHKHHKSTAASLVSSVFVQTFPWLCSVLLHYIIISGEHVSYKHTGTEQIYLQQHYFHHQSQTSCFTHSCSIVTLHYHSRGAYQLHRPSLCAMEIQLYHAPEH